MCIILEKTSFTAWHMERYRSSYVVSSIQLLFVNDWRTFLAKKERISQDTCSSILFIGKSNTTPDNRSFHNRYFLHLAVLRFTVTNEQYAHQNTSMVLRLVYKREALETQFIQHRTFNRQFFSLSGRWVHPLQTKV